MLPLVLLVPLALVSLDLVVPWPSASGVGLPAVLVPSSLAPDAVMSRRLSYYHPGYNSYDDHNAPYKSVDPYAYDEGRAFEVFYYLYIYGMMLFMIWVPLMVASLTVPWVFACRYKMNVTDNRPPLQDGLAPCAQTDDFETRQFFGCLEHMSTCLHALCCPVCRAADTYKGAGIEEYWGVVLYFILAIVVGDIVGIIVEVLIVMSIFAGYPQNYSLDTCMKLQQLAILVGYTVSILIVGLFLQKYRRTLRAKLCGREDVGPNIFVDVLLFGFCTSCVIAQEARELDKAMGVTVECCCLLSTGQPLQDAQPLVGQPVQGQVM
ncbi:unnamed protein product [Prorocentrum cordatum]|uniref:Protein S-acyltransferase n=1 Tax=Prorocentrum cordatum TaxID=2364126 RepID=A0ABN9UID7_9DINO|nr:unnamed protein product [Polarella glacialis]